VPLKDKLLTVPQKEKSGEDSDSAFAYQKNWAFHQLLKLHLDNNDYVFVFEYHDDILILDSEEPSKALFIQVKKSDKTTWTPHRLTTVDEEKDAPKSTAGSAKKKRIKKKKLSILGKLYTHCVDFNGEQISLKFVSDMHFTFCPQKTFLADSGAISQDVKNSFITAIRDQVKDLKTIDLKLLTFEISELNFESHDSHLKGEIENFIIRYFGQDANV
jgi:hypothetical protein